MFESWLKCEVFKGMFSDELAVQVSSLQGNLVSFFVPKSTVSEGKLRVRVFRDKGTAWAVLPTENQTTIPVRDADLIGK